MRPSTIASRHPPAWPHSRAACHLAVAAATERAVQRFERRIKNIKLGVEWEIGGQTANYVRLQLLLLCSCWQRWPWARAQVDRGPHRKFAVAPLVSIVVAITVVVLLCILLFFRRRFRRTRRQA